MANNTNRPRIVSFTANMASTSSAFARMSMMHAFSGEFRGVARRLVEQSQNATALHDIGLPAMCVIASATALDSFVNEKLERLKGDLPSVASQCEKLLESKQTSLAKKWAQLLALGGRPAFTAVAEPYLSFEQLIHLRNVLVHRAARIHFVEDFPELEYGKKVKATFKVKDLAVKFPFSAAPGLTWERQVLTPDCAKWAHNVAVKMMVEHCRLTADLGAALTLANEILK
jgi:hypothetical protein